MLVRNLKLLFAVLILLLASCQSGQEPKSTSTETANSNFHKIVVKEVLQASEYTYLHSDENNNDIWLAVPSMQAKVGETYYYEGGIEMKKFESKDLKRVFESVILLEKLNTEPKSSAVVAADKPYTNSATQPAMADNSSAPATDSGAGSGGAYTRKPPVIEKKEIKLAAAKGGITIAELYAKKDSYSGRTVKIRGEVTKYTPAVMGKNWIHLQDGTDANGKFDLAVTSDAEMKVGDMVTLEGKISLNKDLGYGYFFDVIMEEAAVR
jgi:hypothetical protein